MRVFFGAVVGAIVVFVWGWVAWAGIDLYGFAIKGMPNEEIAVPALQANLPESGAYYFPAMPGDMKDKAAMDAYAAKHQAGPIGMVLFRKQGAPPMNWNWMMFPDNYTIAMVADTMIAWTLGGGVIAMIVRTPASA